MKQELKRVVFLKNAPNIPKPSSLVILNKENVHKLAMDVYNKGKSVNFLTTFVDIKTGIPIKNDFEIKNDLNTNILGIIRKIYNVDKKSVCEIEVPYILIDGFPMLIVIDYNDVNVVSVFLGDVDLSETKIGLSKNILTIGGEVEKKYYLTNLFEIGGKNLSYKVLSTGISECSLFDVSEFRKNVSELKEKIESNNPYKKINKSLLDDMEKDVVSDLINTFGDNNDVIKTPPPPTNNPPRLMKEGSIPQKLMKDEIISPPKIDEILNNPLKYIETELVKPYEKEAENELNDYAKNNHVMIDMETLSTEDNAVVTEISLARFTPSTGEIHQRLKVKFNIDEMMKLGFDISHSTLFEFWLKKQDPEAIKKVLLDDSKRLSYQSGWEQVFNFLSSIENVNMWGKGPTFDLTKLKHHHKKYSELGNKHFPKYYNEKCVRTILAIDPNYAKKLEFKGIKHESMSDVEHQIKQVSRIIKKYKLHIVK